MRFLPSFALTAAAVVLPSSLLLSPVAAAATTVATPPAPVSDVGATPEVDAVVVHWTASPDTDEAFVCWNDGSTAPSTPADAGTCHAPVTDPRDTIDAPGGQTLGISVFAGQPGSYSTPVSVVATTDYEPIAYAQFKRDIAVGSHGVKLTWFYPHNDDSDEPYDFGHWEVRVNKGATPPAESTEPDYTTVSPEITLQHLVTDQPYTVAVRAKGSDGRLGKVTTITVAARHSTSQTARRENGAWVRRTLPNTSGRFSLASLRVPSTGRYDAVYVVNGSVLFSSEKPGGAWSKPVYLRKTTDRPLTFQDPRIARSPDGTLLASWRIQFTSYYRVRPAHHSAWGPIKQVPCDVVDCISGPRFEGVVLDGRDKIHIVAGDESLHHPLYVTNAAGKWTAQWMPVDLGISHEAISYDRARKRIVVAEITRRPMPPADPTTEKLLLATAKPSAAHLGSFHTALEQPAADGQFWQVSLATGGGRISAGVTELEPDSGSVPIGPEPQPFLRSTALAVVTGTSPGSMGRPVIVRGTGPADAGLTISMSDGRHLVAAWSRRDPKLGASDGAYASVAHLPQRGTRWVFAKKHLVLRGPYAMSDGGFLDGSGHLVVLTTVAQRNPWYNLD